MNATQRRIKIEKRTVTRLTNMFQNLYFCIQLHVQRIESFKNPLRNIFVQRTSLSHPVYLICPRDQSCLKTVYTIVATCICDFGISNICNKAFLHHNAPVKAKFLNLYLRLLVLARYIQEYEKQTGQVGVTMRCPGRVTHFQVNKNVKYLV